MNIYANPDFAVPQKIKKHGRVAVETIQRMLEQWGLESSGGCKAFYSPQEWRERGEEHGLDAVLIVCHDGGDLAPIFNLDYAADNGYRMNRDMQKALQEEGLFAEQCTGWYTAIYPIH